MFLQLHFSVVLIEHSEAHRLLLFHCFSLSTEHMKLHHLLLFTAAQSSTRMVCHTLSTMEWRIFRPRLRSIALAIQLQQQVTLLACTRVSVFLTQVWMQDVHTQCYSLILICSGQSSPLQVSSPQVTLLSCNIQNCVLFGSNAECTHSTDYLMLFCFSNIWAPTSCLCTLSCCCCIPCDLPLYCPTCNVCVSPAVPVPTHASKYLLLQIILLIN